MLQISLQIIPFHNLEESIFEHEFYLAKPNLETEFFEELIKLKENDEVDLKSILGDIIQDIDPKQIPENKAMTNNLYLF